MISEITTDKNYEYFDNIKTYQESMIERRINIVDSLEEKNTLNSKEKIIKLLELEYDDLEKQQIVLFYSNEEMLHSDPNDIEIIECRAENLKFIQNNLTRMKEIIDELLKLDNNHFFKNKDVFKIDKFEKTEVSHTNNKKINIQNLNYSETIDPIEIPKNKIEDNILEELEL